MSKVANIKKKTKFLFLDLDGTIIETKSGETFPVDKDDWKFKKGILPKISEYYQKGFQLAIITNQAGIGDGHITILNFFEKLNTVLNNIAAYISSDIGNLPENFQIPRIVATHKNHKFRKPNPDGILYLQQQFNIDLKSSVFVGDASSKEDFSDSDRQCAINAGVGTYFDVEEFITHKSILDNIEDKK